MKKIMMAAAIALAAIGVQAASVDWLFNETIRTDKPFNDLDGATAFLYLASDWATIAGGAKDGSISADSLKGYLDTASLTKATAATVYTYSMDQKTVTDAKVAGEQNYNIVLTDGDKIWVSDTITQSSWDETAVPEPTHTVAKWSIGKAATSKFLTDANAAFTVGGGSDTPEPTSAMLLLLGVAGLALRRKAK